MREVASKSQTAEGQSERSAAEQGPRSRGAKDQSVRGATGYKSRRATAPCRPMGPEATGRMSMGLRSCEREGSKGTRPERPQGREYQGPCNFDGPSHACIAMWSAARPHGWYHYFPTPCRNQLVRSSPGLRSTEAHHRPKQRGQSTIGFGAFKPVDAELRTAEALLHARVYHTVSCNNEPPNGCNSGIVKTAASSVRPGDPGPTANGGPSGLTKNN